MSFDFCAWYDDAHKLLSLSKQAGGWFRRCNRNTISASDDPTPEAIRERFDNLEIELKAEGQVILLESNVIRHAQAILERDFHLLWPLLEPAYFDLRDIEAEGLGRFRCAWFALHELAKKTQQWAVDVWAVAHREKRGLNCGEWCDWMDKAGWLSNTVDALHARLTLEKSWLLNRHPPLVITEPKTETPRESTIPKSQRLDASFVAALKEWHRFDAPSMTCSEAKPIPHEKLATMMGKGKGGTPKNKIAKAFGSQDEYESLCKDLQALAAKLATIDDNLGINKRLAETLAGVNAKLRKAKSEGFLDESDES